MNSKIQNHPLAYRLVISALVVIILLPLFSIPAGASGPLTVVGKWDRLNPGSGDNLPEHEALTCGGDQFWLCRYDVRPEPQLGYVQPPGSIYGIFTGQERLSSWVRPEWFTEDIPEEVISVIGGEMNYYVDGNSILFVYADLIVTETPEGNQVLYFYWVDQFVCPWYRSFDAALEANPDPYNNDCTFK
jgi:hypothetical protein